MSSVSVRRVHENKRRNLIARKTVIVKRTRGRRVVERNPSCSKTSEKRVFSNLIHAINLLVIPNFALIRKLLKFLKVKFVHAPLKHFSRRKLSWFIACCFTSLSFPLQSRFTSWLAPMGWLGGKPRFPYRTEPKREEEEEILFPVSSRLYCWRFSLLGY